MILLKAYAGWTLLVVLLIAVSSLRNAKNGRKMYFLRKIRLYFMNQAISLDVVVNALFGGSPRETISSRMGKNPDCRWCNLLCRFLDKIDPDHCAKSVDPYRGQRDVWKI